MKNMIIAALFTFSQIAFAGPSGVDVKAGNQMSGMLFRENHSLNAGFEANNENNVTDSSGIATVTSTSPISGNYSLAIDATTSGELVKILGKTIKQVGTSCESVFYYTGDATLYKAYVLQGATKVSQELTLSNVGTNVQPVSLIFPCGSGTAPDVTIESTGNGAAIKVDDFYSGMPVNIGTVAQAQLLGTLSYATTAGCNWSTSSTSFTSFTADGDCPTPIVTGQITAPGTKVPGFSIASLAPGSLMIVPQATLYKTTTTDSVCSFRLSDGTNTTTATNIYTGTATPFGTSSSYQFTYTTAQSNLTVQFQALSQSGSSTCGIDNGTSPRATSFDVYYFPSQSQTVVSTQQAEFAETDCPAITGSWTTNTTYTCKWSRRKNRAYFDIRWSLSGAPTSTGLIFNLPITVDTAKLTTTDPSIILPGGGGTFIDTGVNAYPVFPTLETSTSVRVRSMNSASTSLIAAVVDATTPFTSGNTDIGSIKFDVPVVGWIENPFPLIPQSVISDSAGVEKICRATIANSGTASFTTQSGCFTNISRDSGSKIITLTMSGFSGAASCNCTPNGNPTIRKCGFSAPTTSTTVTPQISDNSGNGQDQGFEITCVGPR